MSHMMGTSRNAWRASGDASFSCKQPWPCHASRLGLFAHMIFSALEAVTYASEHDVGVKRLSVALPEGACML